MSTKFVKTCPRQYLNRFPPEPPVVTFDQQARREGNGSHYEDLFFEPFYQFMRQQFLAGRMECARELRADVVSVLHIAPSVNSDFRAVPSPQLAPLGDTAVKVWSKLAREGRFRSIYTEDLFRTVADNQFAQLQPWQQYMVARYPRLTRQSRTAAV